MDEQRLSLQVEALEELEWPRGQEKAGRPPCLRKGLLWCWQPLVSAVLWASAATLEGVLVQCGLGAPLGAHRASRGGQALLLPALQGPDSTAP